MKIKYHQQMLKIKTKKMKSKKKKTYVSPRVSALKLNRQRLLQVVSLLIM
jgi:hypothetical protein